MIKPSPEQVRAWGWSWDPTIGSYVHATLPPCGMSPYNPNKNYDSSSSLEKIHQGLLQEGIWGRRPERQVQQPVQRKLTDTEWAFLDSIVDRGRRNQLAAEWATNPEPEPGYESSTVKHLRAEEQYLEQQIADLEAQKTERQRLWRIARETLNEAAWEGLSFQEKLQWARDWEAEQSQSG